MADTAVHLEREVLPRVPIRHWIASLPWGLRALLGYDRKLCAQVASVFVEEMSRSLKRRAKRLLALATVREALTGAVLAVQRVDSACRLNVHFHVLALDGVYVRHPVAPCPRCGGAMHWLQVATTADARARADHGIAPRAPPPARPPVAEQLGLPFMA